MAKPRTPKPGKGFFTDPKMEKRLRNLWASPRKYSYTELAERFGPPCTRDTVAGAVYRLGLPSRKQQAEAEALAAQAVAA